jgi:hypothetical protein
MMCWLASEVSGLSTDPHGETRGSRNAAAGMLRRLWVDASLAYLCDTRLHTDINWRGTAPELQHAMSQQRLRRATSAAFCDNPI